MTAKEIKEEAERIIEEWEKKGCPLTDRQLAVCYCCGHKFNQIENFACPYCGTI